MKFIGILFLAVIMAACRSEVSVDAGAETSVVAEVSEARVVNLDPAQVAVRPIPNTTMFSRVYEVGPDILGLFSIITASPLSDELRAMITETDELVFLSPYNRFSSHQSPYPRELVYNQSTSELIAYGNVHFLEEVDVELKSFSSGFFGANVHVRAELYRMPVAGDSKREWTLADMEDVVPHQSFDLFSAIGETAKVEWSDGFSDSMEVSTEWLEKKLGKFSVKVKLKMAGGKENSALSYDGKVATMNGEAMLVNCENGNLMKLTTTLKHSDGNKVQVELPLDKQKVDYIAPQQLPGSPLILYSFLIDQITMKKLFEESKEDEDPFSDVFLPQYEEVDIPRVFPPELGDYFEVTDVVRDFRWFMRKKGVLVPSDGYILYNKTKSHIHLYGTEDGADAFREIVKELKETKQEMQEVLVELNTDAVNSIAAMKQTPQPPILESYRVPPDLIILISDGPNISDDPFADPFGEDPVLESLASLADQLTQRLEEAPRVVLPKIEGMTDAGDSCYDIRSLLENQGIHFSVGDWAVFNATRETVVAYTSPQRQIFFEDLFAALDGRSYMIISIEIIEVSLPFTEGFIPTKPEEIYNHAGAKVESSCALLARSGEQAQLSIPKLENEDIIAASITVEAILDDYKDRLDLNFLYQRASTKASSSLKMRNGQTQWLKLYSDPSNKRDHYLLIHPKIIVL